MHHTAWHRRSTHELLYCLTGILATSASLHVATDDSWLPRSFRGSRMWPARRPSGSLFRAVTRIRNSSASSTCREGATRLQNSCRTRTDSFMDPPKLLIILNPIPSAVLRLPYSGLTSTSGRTPALARPQCLGRTPAWPGHNVCLGRTPASPGHSTEEGAHRLFVSNALNATLTLEEFLHHVRHARRGGAFAGRQQSNAAPGWRLSAAFS